MLIRILKKLGLFKSLNLNFTRTINTTRFIIPVINGIGEGNLYANEEWKIPLLEKLTKFKKGLFVDVGVNIGHTLLKLKSVNPDHKYIGFEPNASCVNYLKALIKSNGIKNADIIPVAVGNKNELLQLNFHFGNDEESASLVHNFRPQQSVMHKEFVPVLDYETIKPLLTELTSTIKIDVEGFELEVIKGLSDLIDRDKPAIICEVLPVYSADNMERINRQDELQAILKQREYKMFRILFNGKLAELNEIEIHSNMDLTYYLFAHKNDYEQVKSQFSFN